MKNIIMGTNSMNRYHKENFTCAFCEKTKNGIEMKYLGNSHSVAWNFFKKNESNHVCHDCLSFYFEKCSICNRFHEKVSSIRIEDVEQNICPSCIKVERGFFFCSCCKKYFSKNLKSPLKDHCSKCYTRNFAPCKHCLINHNKKDLIFESYCHSCFENHSVLLESYNFKPTPKFFDKGERNPLYLGVELELGNSTIKCVNLFSHFLDKEHFYSKRDGSIPNYGCEIVSHPCTYQYHVESGMWNKALHNASKCGLKPSPNTGIHIHIDRSFFSKNQIAFLDCFVNSFPDFWKKIAGRDSSYARFQNKGEWGIQSGTRNCCVNLSNSSTIEIRIFKSTVDLKELMLFLAICEGLSMFSKQYETHIVKFKEVISSFRDFMSQNYKLDI